LCTYFVTIVQPVFLVEENAPNASKVTSGFSLIDLRLRRAFNWVCFLILLTVAAGTAAGCRVEQ
jgi:hypothetical protein